MDTQQPPLPSSARKRRCDRTVDLNSFFLREEDKPRKPRFLLMSCSETEKTFKSVSAVRLARAIEESFGKLQAVVRQRNGTILFEARTDEQIEKILKTEQIAGLQVEVTTHPTLNLCKGVVNHEDFATENEDELLSFFKSYGVTEVYRIRRKENGKEIPTSTLILTFNLPSLPEYVSCGYYNLRVRQYVPNPLRCFKCQRFGHTQQRCMAVSPACAKCGNSAHDPNPCSSPARCVNCEGDHAANSNKCPTYLREREIQRIRVTEKVSFPEAKRRYLVKNPVDLRRSFSSTLANTVKATSIQSSRATPPVANFCCQVSPVDFPEETSPLQGGKIIIPTKFKTPPKKTTKTKTEQESTSQPRKKADVTRPAGLDKKNDRSSKLRPPTPTLWHPSGVSEISQPERSLSLSSSGQDESASEETSAGVDTRSFGRQRRKKEKKKSS